MKENDYVFGEKKYKSLESKLYVCIYVCMLHVCV